MRTSGNSNGGGGDSIVITYLNIDRGYKHLEGFWILYLDSKAGGGYDTYLGVPTYQVGYYDNRIAA